MKDKLKIKKVSARELARKQPDEPIRILIGSCHGTMKDAEMLARAKIERYFDIPGNSWLLLHKKGKNGFIYEIHEGGAGRAYLPNILEWMKLADQQEADQTLERSYKAASDDSEQRSIDNSVIENIREGRVQRSAKIIPLDGRPVEVIRREDGEFSGIVHPGEKLKSPEMQALQLIGLSKTKMKPYISDGSDWYRIGFSFIALGLLTISTAGVIHKSFDIAAQGLDEIVETLPTYRLVTLSNYKLQDNDFMPSYKSLPSENMLKLKTQMLDAYDVVSRFYYEDGSWEVEVISKASMSLNDENTTTEIDDKSTHLGSKELSVDLEPKDEKALRRMMARPGTVANDSNRIDS